MAAIWGRATVAVDADGDALPTQVRAIATEAGNEAGGSMGKSLSKAFDKEMKRNGTSKMGQSFKTFFRDLNKELKQNGSSWRDLSHNTRQWTLIIGAVASTLPDLTGLLSAAGVGVLALGSAIGSLTIGLGVSIAVFKRFTGDIADVPAEVLGARKAFDALGDTLSDLNKALTIRAFKDTEGAWSSLGDTIKGLQGPLEGVADVLSGLIQDFAKNLAPGTKNFASLTAIITEAAPIFDSLVRSVGTFGSALLTAFANPTMQSAVRGLAGWINDLATGFDRFVNSPAYDTWVNQGVSVFEHLGGLIEGIGDALGGLFDQQSTDNLNNFIDGLTDFFKGPGKSLIEFLDQLNIPGVVVDTLNNLGNALKPILDFATEFMKKNPEEVSKALTAIASAFLLFKGGSIIAGVASNLVSFNNSAKGVSVSKLNKLAGAITGLSLAFTGLSDANSENGGAGLTAIGGALTGASFAGPIGALVGTVAGLVASMIQDVFLTPEVKGSWQKGWDQLFDPNNYTGMGIGPLKKWFQQELMAPSEDIPAAGGGWLDQVVSGWGGMLNDFRDVHMTNFWAGLNTSFTNGWTQISGFFDTFLIQPLTNGWNQIVTFFTVGVPGFFAGLGPAFANGWTQITTFFDTNFVQPVNSAWTTFWTGLVGSAGTWLASIGVTISTRVSGWVTSFTTGLVAVFIGVQAWFVNLGVSVGTWLAGVGPSIVTKVSGWAADFATGFSKVFTTVQTWVTKILGQIQRIANNPLGAIGSLLSGNGLEGFAAGGVLTGPRRILAGEAGPEAIVPLNRPLGAVDPSVRWLSAIAQNKGGAMASGGVVGGGRTLMVSEGAIVVNDHSGDVRRTGNEVITRLVERLAG